MSDTSLREMFASTIERLLADLSTPEAVLASDDGSWPSAMWDAVQASGFALAAAPEAEGGAGASWHDLYDVLASCGRHNLPLPLPEAILANWVLGQAGLSPVDGPVSVTATSSLSIAAGKVSGMVINVPWGRHVGRVLCIADEEGVPFLVLLDTATAAPLGFQQNIAGEPRDDLRFDAVVPVATAALTAGLPADVLLRGGALIRASQTAGALQTLLELTIRYATERVQFGKPIGNFQAIGHQIALLAEHVALASVTAEAACAESDTGGLALLPIAAAKVNAAESAGIAAGIAHAVHGAIGFTHEHQLHLTTRRLWSWRSEFGSSTEWSQRIGHAACSAGADGYWAGITAGTLPALGQGLTP
jgi:acyl-CoA dehydrogenase